MEPMVPLSTASHVTRDVMGQQIQALTIPHWDRIILNYLPPGFPNNWEQANNVVFVGEEVLNCN